MRLALGLLLANYLGFALFLVLRPSAAEYLRAKDEALHRGEFTVSDADPTCFIAGRPLYDWQPWHGGESMGVKVLEVANFPALSAAGFLTRRLLFDADSYYQNSDIPGLLFLPLATAQWLGLGWMSRGWSALRRRNASTGRPSPP
jgi:hypothetical protein